MQNAFNGSKLKIQKVTDLDDEDIKIPEELVQSRSKSKLSKKSKSKSRKRRNKKHLATEVENPSELQFTEFE